MDRQPIGLYQKQDEERGDQKQMRRAPIQGRLLDQQVVDDERQHRLGQERDADENENEGGLGENSQHHGA